MEFVFCLVEGFSGESKKEIDIVMQLIREDCAPIRNNFRSKYNLTIYNSLKRGTNFMEYTFFVQN